MKQSPSEEGKETIESVKKNAEEWVEIYKKEAQEAIDHAKMWKKRVDELEKREKQGVQDQVNQDVIEFNKKEQDELWEELDKSCFYECGHNTFNQVIAESKFTITRR